MSIRDETLAKYLEWAQIPGAKAYIWRQVQELAKDPSGLFTDFDKEFLKAIDERRNKCN